MISFYFILFNHYSHATYGGHGEIMSCLLSARWRPIASAPVPSAETCPQNNRKEERERERQKKVDIGKRKTSRLPPRPLPRTPRSRCHPPRPAPASPHPWRRGNLEPPGCTSGPPGGPGSCTGPFTFGAPSWPPPTGSSAVASTPDTP